VFQDKTGEILELLVDKYCAWGIEEIAKKNSATPSTTPALICAAKG
jgi:hypothetical protein